MTSTFAPGGRHIFDYLNVIPREDSVFDDSFDPNDLSQYTGAKFFDFDMGQPGEDVGIGKKDVRGNDTASVVAVDLVLKDGEMDFLNDFDNFDFQPFTATSAAETLQPTITALAITIPPLTSLASASASPSPGPFSPKPAKRKPSADPDSFEEASRLAAEEDKRRRNTAASARFRVKKKQREQALERTAKEMTDKCASLEQRISQLEMENKWLKNLIVEKNNAPEKEGEDLNELFAARYSAAVANGDVVERKDGVGTN